MLTSKTVIFLSFFLLSSCTPRSMPTIAPAISTIQMPTPENITTPNSTSITEPQIILNPVSHSSYIDSSGTLWIVGEIGTDGSVNVQDSQIIVSLIDKDGHVVAFGSNLVRYIPAYSKFPFRVSINNVPKQWDQIRIQAEGFPYNDQSIFPIYSDLRANKVTGTQTNDGYKLNGEIVNGGEKTAILVDVVAVAYGENGPVIDVSSTRLSEIASGSVLPFSLVFSHISGVPPSYWIYLVSSKK